MKNKNRLVLTLAVVAAMFICAGTMAMATEIRIVKGGPGPQCFPGEPCGKSQPPQSRTEPVRFAAVGLGALPLAIVRGGPGPACIPGDPCGGQ
jgi:hypothetical protein